MIPDTQAAAWDAIQEKRPTIKQRVLQLFETYGPMTDLELCDRYREQFEWARDSSIIPRRIELKMIDSGKRRCGPSGQPSIIWKIGDER